jgi:hypothetical protein
VQALVEVALQHLTQAVTVLHMGGDLVLELIIISVPSLPFVFVLLRLCALFVEARSGITILVSTRYKDCDLIKSSLYQKKCQSTQIDEMLFL